MKKALTVAVVVVLLCCIPAAYAVSFQNDYEAIDRAAQSVFLLEVYDGQDRLLGTGSGFVALNRSILITNHHVIEGAAYLVAYSDGYKDSFDIEYLLAADPAKDIAILEFDVWAGVQPLAADTRSRLLRGQPVTAIGSPKGVINTVTSGNISNIVEGLFGAAEGIQFTAPISPGSSGGALLNENGEVIGLCAAALTEGDAMYYAVPIKYVEELYEAADVNTEIPLYIYNGLDPASFALRSADGTEIPDDALVYEEGDESGDIGMFKIRLFDLGYWSASDEYGDEYTPKLTAAIMRFQRENRMAATGQIDAGTVNRLLGENATEHPTLVSAKTFGVYHAAAEVGRYGKRAYIPNDSGEEVLRLKKRLQRLGYYPQDAELNDTFDSSMAERVVQFQTNNGLVDYGFVDYATLIKLHSLAAVTGPWKSEPTATATPRPEKAVALEIPDDGLAETRYGTGNTLCFRLQVENTSRTRTITAYELQVCPIDGDGQRMFVLGGSYTLSGESDLKPGKTAFTPYVIMNDGDRIAGVNVAVYQVTYADGTVETVAEPECVYWSVE